MSRSRARERGRHDPSDRALARREFFAVAGALATGSCGGSSAFAPRLPNPPSFPLRLHPVVDLVPAAGLIWLVEARPSELWANPITHRVATTLVAPARFDLFAIAHGGLDLRQTTELVVAEFDASSMVLALAQVKTGSVERAFESRVGPAPGRASDHGVARLWGQPRTRGTDGVLEELVIFGSEGVGWARGRQPEAIESLRAARLFAEGRIRRSLPALRAEPLAFAAAAVGGAPLRFFAPCPFEGATSALGGLLRATTAVAAALRPCLESGLTLEIAMVGAWNDDGPSAAERLAAAFGAIAEDPLGRVLGVDRPLVEPRAWCQDGALRLNVTLDAMVLAHGLHTVTSATVDEMMAY